VSTILKALQRLEDEKRAGKDRSLNEQIVARRSGVAAKSRWLAIGIALLGGVAVGSSALYFWPDAGAPAADVTLEAAPPVVASSASQPKSAALAADSPAETLGADQAAGARKRERKENRAATPVSPMVEVVERLEEKPAAKPVRAESSDSDPVAPGASRPADRRRAAREAAKKKSGSTPTERTNRRPAAAVSKRVPEPRAAEPPVVVAAVDQTEAAVSTDAAAVEDAAVVSDPPLGTAEPSQPLSASTSPATPPKSDRMVIHRAQIPLISVDKTIWHPDGDRRSAVVKLTETGEELQLKQGDAVGPLVIETIRPGGVLFIHDGVEVEYRVGQ